MLFQQDLDINKRGQYKQRSNS